MNPPDQLPEVPADHTLSPREQLSPILAKVPPLKCSRHPGVTRSVLIDASIRATLQASSMHPPPDFKLPQFHAFAEFKPCEDCPADSTKRMEVGCGKQWTRTQVPIEMEIETSIQQQLVAWSRELERPRCNASDESYELPLVKSWFETSIDSYCLRPVHEECIDCALEECGVPRLLLNSSFENFIIDPPESESHLKICQQFATASKGILFMFGNVGTGKTHLAVAILRALGGYGLFRRHADLLAEHRRSYRNEEIDLDELRRRYRGWRPLIIDEVRPVSSASDDEPFLFDLINDRYERMLPTVITTNIPRDDLERALGTRILDRIRHAQFAPLEFGWESKRRAFNESYLNRCG